MSFLHRVFLRLYMWDVKLRNALPSWAKEIIGGLLLSVAAGSFWRATAISAGYEALVDQSNANAKDGFVDFGVRQLAIVAWYFVIR